MGHRTRHLRALAPLIVAALLAGCGSTVTPTASPAGSPTAPPPTPTATPEPTPTPTPTAMPDPTESVSEVLPRDQFGDPATVDNEWLPLVPGTRLILDGEVIVEEERVPHQVIRTVTDLTKVIDGVRSVVLYEVDYTAGEIVEVELAFFAQDDAGTIWLMGEYPEEYEGGALVDAPTWLSGIAGAAAGIAMRAQPRKNDPSYAQGWGPTVGFNDRARVFELNSRTCVPLRCYDQVLVMDEFNPDEPDAHQLKYYARGVGNVRVGWAGALDPSQETLELERVVELSADELADIRENALALEQHAYEISPDVYGRTSPMEAP